MRRDLRPQGAQLRLGERGARRVELAERELGGAPVGDLGHRADEGGAHRGGEGDEDAREYVLERLDQMVVKPVDGSGGYGLTFGPTASDEELAATAAAIRSPASSQVLAKGVTPTSSPVSRSAAKG